MSASMKRVWVTGIAGFLGSHTAGAFLARGWDVVGIGNPPTTTGFEPPVSRRNGEHACAWGPISAESLARALNLYGPPDIVVHAAGSGAVAASFADPLGDFERAVATTATLLDCLRIAAPHARLVLPSSAAVYGVRPAKAISEAVEPAPVSPYGSHKWMAELLCRQASHNFGQPTSVVRFFSLYGPKLRKQILWDLANRLKPDLPELVMDGTGDETRDMLYIDDAVDLLCLLADQQAGGFQLFNGGTGQVTTVRRIAQGLIRRISPATRLVFTGRVRAGDPQHLLADVDGAAGLGFAPKVGLDEGLDRYVSWFQRTSAE